MVLLFFFNSSFFFILHHCLYLFLYDCKSSIFYTVYSRVLRLIFCTTYSRVFLYVTHLCGFIFFTIFSFMLWPWSVLCVSCVKDKDRRKAVFIERGKRKFFWTPWFIIAIGMLYIPNHINDDAYDTIENGNEYAYHQPYLWFGYVFP